VDSRAANKRVFEALIKAGALDELAPQGAAQRAAMLAALDRALESGAKAQRDRASGQGGLFEAMMIQAAEPELPAVKPWTRGEQLTYEKEALGFYASGHPLEDFAPSLQGLANADTSSVAERGAGETVALGGIILDLTVRTTKKGDRFALFRLEDQFGSVKVVCWPEQFNKYKERLADGVAVLVKGRAEIPEEGAVSLIAGEVQPLERARALAAREAVIRFTEASVTPERLAALARVFSEQTGHSPVVFEVATAEGRRVKVRPNQFLRVKISPGFEDAVKAIAPEWELEYVVEGAPGR
jgi:DNA polymerase III subunit alpha